MVYKAYFRSNQIILRIMIFISNTNGNGLLNKHIFFIYDYIIPERQRSMPGRNYQMLIWILHLRTYKKHKYICQQKLNSI